MLVADCIRKPEFACFVVDGKASCGSKVEEEEEEQTGPECEVPNPKPTPDEGASPEMRDVSR